MKIIFNKAYILSTALSNQFIVLTFNIVLFIIIAKSFSTNVLASWAIFQSVTTIIDMIRVGFIQNAMINEIKSNPENKFNIIKSAFLIYTILSVISIITVLIIFQIITKVNSVDYNFTYVKYYTFSVFGIGTLQFINILKQTNENHLDIVKNNLKWVLLSVLFILTLYINKIINPTTILITTGISAFLISLITILKNIKYIVRAKIEKEIISKIIHFGKYVFGTNLVSMLINKSDIFILSVIGQPSSIAAYHIAIRIANYLEIPLNAASQVFYPKLHSAFKNHVKLDKVITDSVIIQWIYIIPAALILFFFSATIVETLAGKIYINESSLLLKIVIFASFIKPIGRTMGIVLDIQNRPDLNLKILILSGIIFITFQLYLGNKFESQGIAVANVLATWISILSAQYFIRNKINFSITNTIYLLISKKLKSKII